MADELRKRNRKQSDLLSICIKAGKTVKGFDSVCEAVKNGKASCVLTASDASEKTLKEINFICGKYGVPVLERSFQKLKSVRLLRKRYGRHSSMRQRICKGI